MLGTLLTIGAFAITAAGTGVQAKASYDQAQESRKQARIQKRSAALQQARDLRASIRTMQMERARTQALAGSQGMGFGSSSYQGAMGGIGSTTAQNIVGINQGFQTASQLARSNVRMANAASLGAIGTGLTNLGSAMMGSPDTIDRVGQYFMGSQSTGAGPQNIIPPGFYGR